MSTIQLRIDADLKKKAQKVAEKLGMDLSSAIKMFLSQMVRSKGIPFEAHTDDGPRLRNEKKILKEIEWAKKYGKRYTSAEELFKDLHAGR